MSPSGTLGKGFNLDNGARKQPWKWDFVQCKDATPDRIQLASWLLTGLQMGSNRREERPLYCAIRSCILDSFPLKICLHQVFASLVVSRPWCFKMFSTAQRVNVTENTQASEKLEYFYILYQKQVYVCETTWRSQLSTKQELVWFAAKVTVSASKARHPSVFGFLLMIFSKPGCGVDTTTTVRQSNQK